MSKLAFLQTVTQSPFQKKVAVCALILLAVFVFSNRYDIVSPSGGTAWRLNTWTGEVCFVVPKEEWIEWIDDVERIVHPLRPYLYCE